MYFEFILVNLSSGFGLSVEDDERWQLETAGVKLVRVWNLVKKKLEAYKHPHLLSCYTGIVCSKEISWSCKVCFCIERGVAS